MAKQDVIFDTDIASGGSNSSSSSKDIYKDIHKLDVNLKRLIQSCENLISNSNSNRDMLSVEKFIPVLFAKYSQLKDLIENKSNQLNKNIQTTPTLTSASSSSSSTASSLNTNNEQLEKNIPSKEALNEYSRKINVLLGLVNQEKLNSPISTRLSMIRLQSSNITHGEKMNEVHTVMKTRNNEEKKKTELLLSSPHPQHNNNNNNSNNNNNQQQQQQQQQLTSPTLHYRAKFQNKNSELSKLLGTTHQEDRLDDPERLSQLSFQDITNQQRILQEDLAREMSDAAMHLKSHSNKMSTMLNSDMSRLDELNSHLTNNHDKIGEEHERLKKYTSSNRKDTLNYFLIIVLVMCLFLFTYFFMKITPVPK
ncbi:putative transmembrane protein [Heterostelium album PN500]|uniref:Putative transmembrane protein n=1 Tax=Heterostelium pallidum (strain ATCC 26659 / Pp 5 / PN500) TaxID=670386 RepID=D3BH54_HETP5|nr:putative transmembrane protein [Heterostelium album PN500]EFA79438.1 putative transmembrane protein [Heterostelium album PN500]|eukprot:XP_020431559.1 putative transmembrane protein [Heterostelium album PN500]